MIKRQLPIPVKDMTPEQRRDYNNEAKRKSRSLARLLSVKEMREERKPAEYECRYCRVTKPYNDVHFYRHDTFKWGLSKRCRECIGQIQCARKYGVTVEEYRKLTTGQCAICEATTKLVLDHCHTSGNVREGLCNSCNTGLGFFCDDPDRMARAEAYIRRHALFA